MKQQADNVNWGQLPSFREYRRARLMQLPPKQAASEQKTTEEVKEVKSAPKPQPAKPESITP